MAPSGKTYCSLSKKPILLKKMLFGECLSPSASFLFGPIFFVLYRVLFPFSYTASHPTFTLSFTPTALFPSVIVLFLILYCPYSTTALSTAHLVTVTPLSNLLPFSFIILSFSSPTLSPSLFPSYFSPFILTFYTTLLVGLSFSLFSQLAILFSYLPFTLIVP